MLRCDFLGGKFNVPFKLQVLKSRLFSSNSKPTNLKVKDPGQVHNLF